jgi:prefoldin subunit 5
MAQSIEYISESGSNVFVATETQDSISIAVDYNFILSNIAQSMFTISTGIQNVNSNLANINGGIQNVNSNLANINGGIQNVNSNLANINRGIQNVNSNLANITSEIQNSNSTLSIISDDINIIRVLGNTGGVGYKTTTPFGWIGSSSLYQLYVEQGYALSNSFVVNAATQEAALDRLKLSARKLKNNLDEDL